VRAFLSFFFPFFPTIEKSGFGSASSDGVLSSAHRSLAVACSFLKGFHKITTLFYRE
jgi:hypothetical protein